MVPHLEEVPLVVEVVLGLLEAAVVEALPRPVVVVAVAVAVVDPHDFKRVRRSLL